MRMRDMFAMASVMVSGKPKKTYWVKNEDGTVSIWVRLSASEGSRKKVALLIEEAKQAASDLGKKAVNGSGRVISCNSFLGSDKDRNLEAVGMATLECADGVENELGRMNLMKVS